jgi:tRNA dimethylallyltransferase
MTENPLLIILGATASGKTKLAVRLADALQGEIISADSRQIYRGMDIGTGKDLKEYYIHGRQIPYHLIDIKEAGERYHVNAYKEDFYRVFKELNHRNVLPILCGGTGMYVHSILQNHEYTAIPVDELLRKELLPKETDSLREILLTYPKEFSAHADLSSHKRLVRAIEIAGYLSKHELTAVSRPAINPFVVGLISKTEERRSRIISRLRLRFEEGMIEEVKGLLDAGVSGEMLTFYGLEYKFITAYLFGALNYVELLDRLSIAICQFAKRQMTFFRKMEKDGVNINWFHIEGGSEQLFEEVMLAFDNWNKR